MRNHEDLMKGEQEIARAELSRERRLAQERKEKASSSPSWQQLEQKSKRTPK